MRGYPPHRWWLAGPRVLYVGLVVLIAAWPLAMLVATAAAGIVKVGAGLGAVLPAAAWGALWNSLWSSGLATLLALGIGCGIAWAYQGLSIRTSTWAHVVALLPLFIPPFIGGFSWVQAYAQSGIVDWGLHWYWKAIYGPVGVIVLLAVHSAPLAYLTAAGALERIAEALPKAVRVHGGKPWHVFWTVLWPVLGPALVAAGGLVFAYNIGDFGIPFELGLPGHFQTATAQIYADLSSEVPGGLALAIALSFVLSLLGAAVLMGLRRAALPHAAGMAYKARASGASSQRWGRIGLAVVLAYTTAAVLIPFGSTVLVALTRAYGLTPVPSHWGLRGVFAVFSGSVRSATWHSMILASLATVLVVLLNVLSAELALHHRWSRRVYTLAWLPYALPGSVVGVAAILGDGRMLYGTLWIILMAYLMRFWGVGDPVVELRRHVPTAPGLAARLFGARPILAYGSGVWPFLSFAVYTTAVLVFVSAVYELTISSLLYTPTTETVATIILNANQSGDVRTMAVMAVWMTLFMLLAVVGLTWMQAATRHSSADLQGVPEPTLTAAEHQGVAL